MPGSWLCRSSPLPGASVPLSWVTRYCSGERRAMASGVFLYVDIIVSSRIVQGRAPHAADELSGLALAARSCTAAHAAASLPLGDRSSDPQVYAGGLLPSFGRCGHARGGTPADCAANPAINAPRARFCGVESCGEAGDRENHPP